MLFLTAIAAAALAPEAPAEAGREPARQARASVRIVRAEPVRFAEIEQQRPNALRTTELRAPDGEVRPVRLVEFE